MDEREEKTMAEIFGVHTTPMAWGIAKQLVAGFDASQAQEPPHNLKMIHLVAMAYQLGVEKTAPRSTPQVVNLDLVDKAALEAIQSQIDMILTRNRFTDGKK